MSTIEEYAIDMVASGAESTIEDDLNEDEDVSEEDHPAAIALGLDIVRAIRANPDAILALARADLATVNDALREAGIEFPLGAAGVRDLAAMAVGRLEDLRTAEAERDKLRDWSDSLMRLVPEDYEMPLPPLPADGSRPALVTQEQIVSAWLSGLLADAEASR